LSTLRLQRWLERIERLHPSEIELGLTRLRRVADALGVNGLPMPVITVAGTNGKGSVVALIRALAEQSGQRCCVYTSPHILHFNERIRLPDGLADDATLVTAFEAVDEARGNTPLTYFEFTTLAALWLFARGDADLTILEVGLGGRLDAVNLIDASVAVVTSVGLDHTDWLGDSREAIAVEKLGIGRPGRPLVYGEHAPPANLDERIARLGAVPLRAGREFTVRERSLSVRGADGERHYTLPTAVALGEDNLATAVQALVAADLVPAPADLEPVAHTALMGRCQRRLYRGVECVLDVGHNLEALSRLFERLPACAGQRRLVLGMMADKPVDAVVRRLASEASRWYLARPDLPRAADTERLARALPASAHPRHCASVAEALNLAVVDSAAGDQVVIVGSFHTVAEALGAMDQDTGQGE
jgi:dihydrofolate synthase/folylpolyglutamate synthase